PGPATNNVEFPFDPAASGVIARNAHGRLNCPCVCDWIVHFELALAGSAFPASNINSIIDYSDRGSSAVHVMAGSSGSPRVTVWIVNKRLSYARAEAVKFSPRSEERRVGKEGR